MNADQASILIVEDDDLQYEIYEEALAAYRLVRVKKGSDALKQIPQDPPDVLILDHVLDADERGLDFLPSFRLLPFVPIIIVSGALEVQQQLKALQGPRRAHIVAQPVDVRELKRTVAAALKECGEAETVRQFEALERSRRVDALGIIQPLNRPPQPTESNSDWLENRASVKHLRIRPRIQSGPPDDHSGSLN
jgi:DNA-binding NtrC family response regulator